MRLKCTTRPEVDAVSLAEAKRHLIVSHDEDNDRIAGLVAAATQLVEVQTARQLMAATWTAYADQFEPEMQLRICPVQSIVEVRYVDPAGDEQVLDSEAYQLDVVSEPARLIPAYGYEWPDTRCQLNAVQVELIAGFADRFAVPDRAKQAILLLVGHWYENRESVVVGTVTKEIELAYEALVSSLRWCAL